MLPLQDGSGNREPSVRGVYNEYIYIQELSFSKTSYYYFFLFYPIIKYTVTVTRKSSIKVSIRQLAYMSSSTPHLFTIEIMVLGAAMSIIELRSACRISSLTFREPLARKLDWRFTIYRARAIHVILNDIIIVRDQPPTETPFIVGGAIVGFVPEDMVPPNIPVGFLRPYPNSPRSDLLSSPLPLYSIPSQQQCHEIIRLLGIEVEIRAFHFMPPQITVELDMTRGKKHNRHSLPSRAGGISIQYHEANESFWKGSSQMGYERAYHPNRHYC